MSTAAQFAIALGVIFAVNLLPAFGPPTWALLVFFSLDFDLPPAPLVLRGAVMAALGRFALATGARRLKSCFSPARLAHLERTQTALTADRTRTVAGLGLFAISPLPSGQLFTAAGLMTVPLVPLTVSFFAGRLVSYSLWPPGLLFALCQPRLRRGAKSRLARSRFADLAPRHGSAAGHAARGGAACWRDA